MAHEGKATEPAQRREMTPAEDVHPDQDLLDSTTPARGRKAEPTKASTREEFFPAAPAHHDLQLPARDVHDDEVGPPPSGEEQAPPSGKPFLGSVPDFLLADWEMARPTPPVADARGGRPLAWPGVLWLMRLAVLSQRSSRVVLPDVLLAQCVWGDRKPANWRQILMERIYGKDLTAKEKKELIGRPCPAVCPLHGRTDVPHRHFHLDLCKSLLGRMHAFAVAWDNTARAFRYAFTPKPADRKARRRRNGRQEEEMCEYLYRAPTADGGPGDTAGDERDPRNPDLHPVDGPQRDVLREQIRRDRRQGLLTAVYLPVLLFGPSPRSGLNLRQGQLLTALTRETTRDGRSTRPDKAQVLVGGVGDASGVAACPYLRRGAPYVGFNGNGARNRQWRAGRGYRLIGATNKGWLSRAGYAVPADPKGPLKAVRRFLKDLKSLSGPFGLAAAAWNSHERQWRPLAELEAMTRTQAGRRWLDRCVVRVYAPADYLGRWRRYFADRLGFAYIPGERAEGEQGGPRRRDGAVACALDLDRWMREKGLTDAQAAARLGVSRSYVSGMRSGRRVWSESFEDRVAGLVGEEARRP